jgi:catechol 2,3-dioxygenase-like lactoylglutathione lyase family enzyme
MSKDSSTADALAEPVRVAIMHNSIEVAELDRSLAFYCGLLGLEERQRVVIEDAGITEVFVGGPDSEGPALDLIHQHAGDTSRTVPSQSMLTHVTIKVPGLPHVADRLAAAGVPVTLRAEFHGALIVFVTDPDGYHVELVGRP